MSFMNDGDERAKSSIRQLYHRPLFHKLNFLKTKPFIASHPPLIGGRRNERRLYSQVVPFTLHWAITVNCFLHSYCRFSLSRHQNKNRKPFNE